MTHPAPQAIDFFYSTCVTLILGVIVLGSFTFMPLGGLPFLKAPTYAIFAVAAGAMLPLDLVWNPCTEFAGYDGFLSPDLSLSASESRGSSISLPSWRR